MWPFKKRNKPVVEEPKVGPKTPAGDSAATERAQRHARRDYVERRRLESDNDAMIFDSGFDAWDAPSGDYDPTPKYYDSSPSYDSTPTTSYDSGSSSSSYGSGSSSSSSYDSGSSYSGGSDSSSF